MVFPVMQMNDARISRITVIKLPEGWGSWKHQMIQIVEELPASWQLSTGVFLGGKLPEKKKNSAPNWNPSATEAGVGMTTDP